MNTPTPCHDWLALGFDDLWHPEAYGRDVPRIEAVAKRICRTCPVQTACLTQALDFEANNPQSLRHGVWGGLDANQRARIAKGRAA